MKRVRSELDEVARRLYELANLIGVSEQELLAFMKVLSKADWANVEFRPLEGLSFGFEGLFGEGVRMEITVRRGNTTIVKEYEVPDILVKGDISEVRLRPPWGLRKQGQGGRAKRGRRRKPRNGAPPDDRI